MARSAVCTSPPHHRGAKAQWWDHFSLPFTPPCWALSSARMVFPITVMPMILNCFCLSLLRTPLSRRGSRTVLLIYPHGWKITTFRWTWPKRNWWSFQPKRSSTTTSISILTPYLLFQSARKLGVIIDDQLTFTDHIASVSRSCRFALFNIRKIRP